MYKRTQNSTDYLTRTGNHSTKGSRKGYCDVGVVVDEAELRDNPDAIRKKLKAVREDALRDRKRLQDALMSLRANPRTWNKNVTYKYKGKEHLYSDKPEQQAALREYFRLGDLVKDCDSKLLNLGKPVRSLPVEFMNEAESLLPEDVFSTLKERAEARLKRPA